MVETKPIKHGHRFKDLTASPPFGRLRVLRFSRTNAHGRSVWVCLCDPVLGGCGAECEVAASQLRSGGTRSCGCLHREMMLTRNTTHGMTRSPEYRVWSNMITRCLNPKTRNYKDYGGRGIRVCERWLKSFEAFLADMGPKPSPKHEIDRFPDNDGNYEPGNCRWTTRSEQGRNQRTNILITFAGRTQCLAAWAEEVGMRAQTLRQRLHTYGWSVDQALTVAVGAGRH